MNITPELLERIADLAQLELTLPEAREAAAELGRVLGYMDVLDQLDTRGVEPMGRMFPIKNVLREDVPVPSLDRAALLAGAPASDRETFLVPQAVEAAE